YPNATVIWSAVVPGGLLGKATPIFYSVDDAPLYNKATTDIHHLLRYGYSLDSIRVVTAPCLVLADLLAMRRQGVDIILIDIEGLDDQIVTDTYLSNFNIGAIQLEAGHIADSLRLELHMRKFG